MRVILLTCRSELELHGEEVRCLGSLTQFGCGPSFTFPSEYDSGRLRLRIEASLENGWPYGHGDSLVNGFGPSL
jgi:hypothetical protein